MRSSSAATTWISEGGTVNEGARRVVIDTDDLRVLAKYLKGSIGQLGEIRVDLAAASVALQDDASIGPALASTISDVDAVGSTLTADHNALTTEVLDLEESEGPLAAGAFAASPSTPDKPVKPTMKRPLAHWPLFTAAGTGAPAPWDTAWVSADGTIPLGAIGSPLAEGFGELFVTRGWETDFDGSATSSLDGDGLMLAMSFSAGAKTKTSWKEQGSAGPVEVELEATHTIEGKTSGKAGLDIGEDGASAEAGISASAKQKVEASTGIEVPGASADGEAYAEQSAYAGAAGEGSVDGEGASGQLQAGAEAGVAAGVEGTGSGPGGTTGTYGSEVRAGVGARADIGGDLGWKKVGMKFDVSGALGIGAGVNVELSFSPADTWNELKDLFDGADAPESPPPAADPDRPIDPAWLDEHGSVPSSGDPADRPIDPDWIEEYLGATEEGPVAEQSPPAIYTEVHESVPVEPEAPPVESYDGPVADVSEPGTAVSEPVEATPDSERDGLRSDPDIDRT